jgi:hypothetical protein
MEICLLYFEYFYHVTAGRYSDVVFTLCVKGLPHNFPNSYNSY